VPRRPRQELAGGVHHVYARGNRKQAIYTDDRDRRSYLWLLGRVTADHRWRCLAYCLMPNHVHLLLETPEPNLGLGMQLLHGSYARWFNDRHGHVGHLFQGRFGAIPIRTDMQLAAVIRYIALNPVRAGLCERPHEWRWGSCGRRPSWLDEPRLLQFLAAEGGNPWRRHAELTAPPNPQVGV